jgi:hypothetical protein
MLRIQLQRAIEMCQRRFRILPRQLDVPQRGFRRIERRIGFQRGSQLALGVPEIAGLEKRPPA